MPFEKVLKTSGPKLREGPLIHINPRRDRDYGVIQITKKMMEKIDAEHGSRPKAIGWECDEASKRLLIRPSDSVTGNQVFSSMMRMWVAIRNIEFVESKTFFDPAFNSELGGYVLDFSKE